MSDIHEMHPNELEKVAGGFIYEGPKEWLRGREIACPARGTGCLWRRR